MKDIHSGMLAVVAIAAATLAADSPALTIDLQNHNAAEMVLMVGAGGITFTGANKIEFVLTHSDDGSAFSPVEIDDVLGVAAVDGSGVVKSLTAAHSAAASYRFGYVGTKRYLRLQAVFSGTHATGTPVAASAILEKGHINPQDDQV